LCGGKGRWMHMYLFCSHICGWSMVCLIGMFRCRRPYHYLPCWPLYATWVLVITGASWNEMKITLPSLLQFEWRHSFKFLKFSINYASWVLVDIMT
jgi:hypothetical protein